LALGWTRKSWAKAPRVGWFNIKNRWTVIHSDEYGGVDPGCQTTRERLLWRPKSACGSVSM